MYKQNYHWWEILRIYLNPDQIFHRILSENSDPQNVYYIGIRSQKDNQEDIISGEAEKNSTKIHGIEKSESVIVHKVNNITS